MVLHVHAANNEKYEIIDCIIFFSCSWENKKGCHKKYSHMVKLAWRKHTCAPLLKSFISTSGNMCSEYLPFPCGPGS